MPIIKTATNRVAAEDPGPDDTHVQVTWFGPSQDGLHRKQFHGPLMPIEDYGAVVTWAVELADQMVHPLYVVPMTDVQALDTDHMRRAMAGLSDQERGDLRRRVAAMLAQVLRDCDDPDVRADAHAILVQMKVVTP